MTTYNIWLCSLNLYVLFTWHLAAFDPFKSLARCHVQICFQKILILLGRDTGSLKITRTMSKLVFSDCSINSLTGCQTIDMLVNFAFGIHLLRLHALRNGSGRSNCIFASQCNKTHLKGRHLSTATDSHRISGSCVKRRIPHFMSGKSRVVWFIKAGSSACCDQNCFCMDHIGCFFHDGKTNCSINSAIFCKKICDIYVIQHIHIFAAVYGICKEWFEVLSIDLNVTVTSCHIISVFILENHKTEPLHISRYIIKFFGCGQKEVISDDACRIFCCIIYIILRFTSFDNISIDCIDTGCQTTASFYVCFFCDQNGCI